MSSISPSPSASSLLPSPSILVQQSEYNYTPTEYVCIIFVVLFSLTTIGHLLATFRYRLWWLFPTVILAGVGEIIGWAGRLWSSQNVFAQDPFMMQIVCTIIAPTPFVAAIFITFGALVRRLGQRYSWLSARLYSRIFLTTDITSLIVQAAGGGIASSATTNSGTSLGANIMLAGIIIQMVALFLFMILGTQFFISFLTNRPVHPSAPSDNSTTTLTNTRRWNSKLKQLSVALAFSSTVLMIRAVYRTIELAGGWNGPVISTQVWFNIFDGAMVVLAMYTWNFFHPGRLLFSQLSEDVTQMDEPKGPGSTLESLA